MGIVEDIDAAAAELVSAPEETYEVAVHIAGDADQYCPGGWYFDKDGDPALGSVAASVRNIFGTWAERIHTHGLVDGSSEAEAVNAHRSIARAVDDWLAGGRLDPAEFVARWLPAVGLIDITWLREGREQNPGR